MGFMGFIGLGAALRPGLWVAGSSPHWCLRGTQMLWLLGQKGRKSVEMLPGDPYQHQAPSFLCSNR